MLEVLADSRVPVEELIPVATENSLGEVVDFAGDARAVESEISPLRSVDLLFLCAPQSAALDWIRDALRAEVPCIDLSGALTGSEEVPLLVADAGPDRGALCQPVVNASQGVGLACYLALTPLAAPYGLTRVVATSFDSVSSVGRVGIDILQSEVVALFNQEELEPPFAFSRNVAFDCIPQLGNTDDAGVADREREAVRALSRLLPGTEIDMTSVQVPTFSGTGVSLVVETATPVDPREAAERLTKSSALELWSTGQGPSTRDPSGRDVVLVGRIRSLPEGRPGLRFWIAADTLRLSAASAVRLAEARFANH